MKLRHLLLTLALAVLLTVSAAALRLTDLETDPQSPYWGMNINQTHQAYFLENLGLFLGTDQGFELDRAMNRCEAGTMLVRLLGKEAEALEENNDHPFTDVPQWADPYIGWLWKNGLTKGMSDTVYGAKKSVTAEQYLIFLSRVLQGSDVADDWWKTGFGDRMVSLQATLDRGGFLRGDAVFLSVWALKTETADGRTLAKRLLDSGVFSWKVFYTSSALSSYKSEYSIDENHRLVRETAGVTTVSEDPVTQLVSNGDNTFRTYIFALRQETDGTWRLLQLDGLYLINMLDDPCTVDPANLSYKESGPTGDYFLSGSQLLCWTHGGLVPVTFQDQPLEVLDPSGLTFYRCGRTFLMQDGYDIWALDGEQAGKLPALDGCRILSAEEDAFLAIRNSDQLVRYDPVADQLTVLLSDCGYAEVLGNRLYFAIGGLYWTGDGLWRYTGGQLLQLAKLSILDAVPDNLGGAYLLTQDDAGRSIIRVSANGALTTALSSDCGHGLKISRLDGVRSDGSLQFSYYHEQPLGNHESTCFVYALDREGAHPAIRVISLQYAFDNGYIFGSGEERNAYYEAEIEKAQQALNDLGLGIS